MCRPLTSSLHCRPSSTVSQKFLEKIMIYHPLLPSPVKGEEIVGITNNSPPLVGGARGGGSLLILETYL